MEERIKQILERHFAGAQVYLDNNSPDGKVSGYVLWEGFTGWNFLRRQNALFQVLRRELGPDAQVVTHIFTYTPNEYEQMNAA